MAKYNPKTKITSLSIRRDGNVMKATWKNPASLTKGDYAATSMDIQWHFDREGVKKPTEVDIFYSARGKEKPFSYTAADRFWAKGFERASKLPTSMNKAFDRSRFHPLAKGKYLKAMQLGIAGRSKGTYHPWVWKTYSFKPPKKPTIKVAYNADTATVTFTIDSKNDDRKERYDTVYKVVLRKMNGKNETLLNWKNDRSTHIVSPWDVSKYITGMQEGKYVEVHCYAYTRGLAGNSSTAAKAVHASRAIGIPSKATVGKATLDKKATTGIVKVPVTAGARTSLVYLERRHGESGSWETVSGAVDDNDVQALYDSWGAVWPNGQVSGEKVYYRVKSTRDNYEVYSNPVEAACLYTDKPTARCGSTVELFLGDAIVSGGSASFKACMCFTDSTPAADGCELSVSTDPNAWGGSTEEPTVYEFTGEDGTKYKNTKLRKSKTVTVTGLDAGAVYYARLRRYRTVDGDKVFSGYSARASIKTQSAENDACLVAVIEPEASGTSARLIIGIKEDNDNTGTEITWSSDRNAWQANEGPKSMNADWPVDNPKQLSQWGKTQTAYVRGLELGTTYYFRAQRYLESSGGTTYGPLSNVTEVTMPTRVENADVRCGIVSIEPGADGRSAIVVVGWDGDHTETEVSWSPDPNGWESTESPSSFSFGWHDPESKSSSWGHTSTCYVTGLEEGATYYVRARSHHAPSDAWSAYSEAVSVTPYSAPASVVLTAPSAVARGEAIEVWWSIESDVEQREWHIHEEGHPNVSLADGEGSLCRATIPAERFEGKDTLAIYVMVGCGGGLTRSETANIGIADIPLCELMASDATAQPYQFEVFTNDPTSRLLAVVRSQGTMAAYPDRDAEQLSGDVVWTGSLAPAWQSTTWGSTTLYAALVSAQEDAEDAVETAQPAFEATDEYAAMVAAKAALDLLTPEDEGYDAALEAYQTAYATAWGTPEGIALSDANGALERATAALAAHPADGTAYRAEVQMPVVDLIDGSSYEIGAKTVEMVGGLSSPEATAAFDVLWAHQAPEPSEDIEITIDAAARTATITLVEPEGWVAGDVYDVYRMSLAGHELIASGQESDAVIVDPYAPFGDADLHYRIATRTPDGDFAWVDLPYELDARGLRFDWDGASVELPWNVEASTSSSKDFEARSHIDGSTEGYWNRSVQTTLRYRASVIKSKEQETESLLEALARHPGAVFCRDSRGRAFQCDAQLGEMGVRYGSAVIDVSIAATAVDLTDEFRAGGEG